jgi:4-aminobutyrate aminotransferase/(S)-3-amino-2-methylpropionate transaminase
MPVRPHLKRSTAVGVIHVTGDIPGPRSKALMERRQRAVSRGLATAHPIFVESASNATITDVDGNVFIDFTGGIGALNVGHARPEVVEAARAQAGKFTHVAIQVNGYEPYVALSERLCALAPMSGDKRAFVVSTGTEACENAVKFARAFTKRQAVIAFEHAFHGRSLGGLSLTSRAKPYKTGFGPFLPEIYRLPYPTWYRSGHTEEQAIALAKARVEEALRTVVAPEHVAALIVETVLGEGGFLVPPRGFLEHLREVCTKHGILLIIDEVQCGFARTGKLFAIEHFGVQPDLLCTAKSLGGGLPVAAVVGRADVMDCVDPGALGGTYAGNPIACAGALAAIDVIEREGLVDRARVLGEQLRTRLLDMQRKLPIVGDVRGIGAMQAIELVRDRDTREPATEATAKVVATARQHGLLLLATGTYANVIRFLMPLTIERAELEEGLDVLESALAAAG